MEIHHVPAQGLRFAVHNESGEEVGHAFLYLLRNNLHEEPFGLVEDVQVDEAERSSGIGRELLLAVIAKAKFEGCYKLIATSRNDGTRQSVHDWYERLGFHGYGTEFRMDLSM